MSISLDVVKLNSDNSIVGSVEVSNIFDIDVNNVVVSSVVRWQNTRPLTGNAKNRSDMTKGKAKPRAQKGSGRSRQGSSVACHFRGGGIAFGMSYRVPSHSVPKKVRKQALRMVIGSKIKNDKCFIVEDFSRSKISTKDLVNDSSFLSSKKSLFVGLDDDFNFVKSVSNIKGFDFIKLEGLNVYDILSHEYLVFSKEAFEKIEQRVL